jgi:hypothetical protein
MPSFALLNLCLWSGLLLLAFPQALHAQKATRPSQSLSLFVMPFPGTADLSDEAAAKLPSHLRFSHLLDGRSVELELPVSGLASPLVRPAAAGFALHAPPLASAAGKTPPSETPAEIAKIDFPADWKNVLILVSASPDARSAKMLAYHVGESALPASHLGLYNLTGQALVARLGKAQVNLNAQGMTLVPLSLPPGRNNASMELSLATRGPGGDWRLVAHQSLVLGKLKRRLAFVIPATHDTVTLMHFRLPPDPIEPQPEPAAAPPAR